MKIKITDFGARHFDSKFGGTKILDVSIESFEKEVNTRLFEVHQYKPIYIGTEHYLKYKMMDGYADFCKLIAIPNFTDARVGSMPITLENYQYLRSGYSARRDSELPVFSRWFELPISVPKAEYLVLVLYSKEQLDKEAYVEWQKECNKIAHSIGKMVTPSNEPIKKTIPSKPEPFDAEWGVVAILGQSHSNEEPMKPETMLRNALGISEGGSGVPLDRVKYLESVEFWDKNATVK